MLPTTAIWNVAAEAERPRLLAQAAMLDPGSIQALEALEVREGWRCAEIGAGTGSVARWLSEKVGPTGHVTATDVDTRFLEDLRRPGLEVRRHDITCESLEEEHYDLVHARLLVALLPDPAPALRRLVAALRPGGWLVVEEYDQRTASFFHPHSELQARVSAAVNRLFEKNGADPYCGSKLVALFRGAGLARVQASARLRVVELGSPEAEILALKIVQLKEKLAAAGLLAENEAEEAIVHARTPGAGVHYPPLLVAASGQRPR
jgi:protein-L-isoaspartate O-methyltransferase